MSVSVAVCIATRNRCAELMRTFTELQRLNPQPDEILVVADGCADETVPQVRLAHPHVRLLIHDVSQGSIPSRNELAASTSCDVMLSLDDDSYPVEADLVARVRELFATRDRLAVVCFPQRSEEFPESLTATSFGESKFVGSFANSGAAIRRSTFRELGGYPAQFAHMYEEPDFALRCVSAGWEVWQDTSRTIRHHYTGAQRSELRNHHRHARNELWSVLMRCPAPQCVGVAAFRIARQFGFACSRGLGWIVREPQWWLAALSGVACCLAARRPLPWARYVAWMHLVGHPIAEHEEWRGKFGVASR